MAAAPIVATCAAAVILAAVAIGITPPSNVLTPTAAAGDLVATSSLVTQPVGGPVLPASELDAILRDHLLAHGYGMANPIDPAVLRIHNGRIYDNTTDIPVYTAEATITADGKEITAYLNARTGEVVGFNAPSYFELCHCKEDFALHSAMESNPNGTYDVWVAFWNPEGTLTSNDFWAPHMTTPQNDFPDDIVDIIRKDTAYQDAACSTDGLNTTCDFPGPLLPPALTSDELSRFNAWSSEYLARHNSEVFTAYMEALEPRLRALDGIHRLEVPHPTAMAFVSGTVDASGVRALRDLPEVATIHVDLPIQVVFGNPSEPLDQLG